MIPILVAPTEPPALKKLGKVSSIPEKWGVDFLFPSAGKWYGIQRKEISDLIASMADGRLAKEIAQMKRLDTGMLIVEGKVRFTLDGELITDGYGQTITKAGIRGILWSVQARGFSVQSTDSISDTFDTIQMFQAYVAKGKHTALDRRPGPTTVWGRANHRDYQMHLLMGLPAVGPELASRIIDEFGGIPWDWSIEQSELERVPGIGKRKAQTIYQAIASDDDNGT